MLCKRDFDREHVYLSHATTHNGSHHCLHGNPTIDAKPGTADGDRLELLTVLVHVYEEKHHALPLPNPIDAIQYYIESRGLTRRDPERYIGSRARVSEVLSRKRKITMEMIRNLHNGLGIPAEVLIQPYKTVKDTA